MIDPSQKMKVLKEIIGLMDDHMMKGLPKKGAQPAAASVTIEAMKPKDAGDPLAAAMDPDADGDKDLALKDLGDKGPDGPASDDDDMDPEMLRKLLDMFGGDKDEEVLRK